MFLVALGRSLLPYLFFQLGWVTDRPPKAFFLPSGLILMYLGAEYLVLALGITSDNKLIIMTRRELGSFFCSPIAYIVLIGMAGAGWFQYVYFLTQIFDASEAAAHLRQLPGPDPAHLPGADHHHAHAQRGEALRHTGSAADGAGQRMDRRDEQVPGGVARLHVVLVHLGHLPPGPAH
jgi:hypothetical protein